MVTSELSNALLAQIAVHQLPGKVCDMTYLLNASRGNKMIIQNILAVFFKETTKELSGLRKAIEKKDHTGISNISHKLRSAFSILGIIILEPVFNEMEYRCSIVSPAGRIEQLYQRVMLVFKQAKTEMNPAI
jgi:HPt (histidine-containing phosphotransfer) domain-containing protein